MRLATTALICCSFLATAFGAQGSSDLARHFMTPKASWRPTSAQTTEARTILARKQTGRSALNAAAHYCLAMAGEDTERHALRLAAMAATATEQTLEALPEALLAVREQRHSTAALDALAQMNLDGAPGDVLSEVRAELFLNDPASLAHAWAKVPAARRLSLVVDIQSSMEDEPKVAAIIKSGSRSKNADLRSLCKQVQQEAKREARSSHG